jgi:hypothetical protein
LCVSSNHGTIHVFNLNNNNNSLTKSTSSDEMVSSMEMTHR